MLRSLRLISAATAVLLCCIILFATNPVSAKLTEKQPLEDNALLQMQLESLSPAGGSRIVSLVHAGADSRSLVVGRLENGTEVTVLEQVGGFYRIDCFDVPGFIACKQVAAGEDGKYYVNCDPDSRETAAMPTYSAQEALALRTELCSYALCFQGVRYADGGSTPRGFDCCGFTYFVFQKKGYDMKRALLPQLKESVIISKEELQPGDLVFFRGTTDLGMYTSHVGLYIGNNRIVHASSTAGIAVADLDHPYYQEHYLCSRRVILTDTATQSLIPGSGIGQNVNGAYWKESTQTAAGLGDNFAP